MDVYVTIRYRVNNICEEADYSVPLVCEMVESEGIGGIAEDDYKIVEVRPA